FDPAPFATARPGLLVGEARTRPLVTPGPGSAIELTGVSAPVCAFRKMVTVLDEELPTAASRKPSPLALPRLMLVGVPLTPKLVSAAKTPLKFRNVVTVFVAPLPTTRSASPLLSRSPADSAVMGAPMAMVAPIWNTPLGEPRKI